MPICPKYKQAVLQAIVSKNIVPRDMFFLFNNNNIQILIQCSEKQCPYWNNNQHCCGK